MLPNGVNSSKFKKFSFDDDSLSSHLELLIGSSDKTLREVKGPFLFPSQFTIQSSNKTLEELKEPNEGPDDYNDYCSNKTLRELEGVLVS